MKRKVCYALLFAFLIYLLISFLNFNYSYYPDILAPIAWYGAMVTFVVSFISYWLGENSNKKK